MKYIKTVVKILVLSIFCTALIIYIIQCISFSEKAIDINSLSLITRRHTLFHSEDEVYYQRFEPYISRLSLQQDQKEYLYVYCGAQRLPNFMYSKKLINEPHIIDDVHDSPSLSIVNRYLNVLFGISYLLYPHLLNNDDESIARIIEETRSILRRGGTPEELEEFLQREEEKIQIP